MSAEVEDSAGKPDGSFDAIRERREAYLAEVRRLEVELGRTPTAEDMQKRGAFGAQTADRLFGGWNRTLVAAGLREGTPVEIVRAWLSDALGDAVAGSGATREEESAVVYVRAHEIAEETDLSATHVGSSLGALRDGAGDSGLSVEKWGGKASPWRVERR